MKIANPIRSGTPTAMMNKVFLIACQKTGSCVNMKRKFSNPIGTGVLSRS